MREVALARLWQHPDGTSCLLLKDGRAENWELRVIRGTTTLKSRHFGSPIVAMDEAKGWRVWYGRTVERPSHAAAQEHVGLPQCVSTAGVDQEAHRKHRVIVWVHTELLVKGKAHAIMTELK